MISVPLDKIDSELHRVVLMMGRFNMNRVIFIVDEDIIAVDKDADT